MDLVENVYIGEPLIRHRNSYKVASLIQKVVETTQTSNFKDRYVLGEQLGWGQFGIIRACTDKLTGEILACKSIAKDRLVTDDDAHSVKLEIEIMTKLSGHPNVVNLKAVYEEEDYVNILMELCAGGELFHRIEKQGRFSEHEARVLFKQLMQVVIYCHEKGIVHRDLKPENILLANKSSSSPIKLADFGLATYIKIGQDLHGTVGSPFYIAPEVLGGGYNQAADMWSAGVILYILLSGMPPFWGKTKSKIFNAVRTADLQFPPDPWEHVSSSAKDLITRMLCVNSSERLTATEVLGHVWMMDLTHETQEPSAHTNHRTGHLDDVDSYLCPSFVRNQDYSFRDRTPATIGSQEGNSPVFTCKSSFSSFLVNQCTPCSISVNFSFGSCCESVGPEFSSPFTSTSSFTFFSPSLSVEQGTQLFSFQTTELTSVDRESGLRKLLVSKDPSEPIRHELGEERRTELWRGGGISGLKGSSIHNRRNRTIGLGELDQFDLVVTESFIRWASCTHIPSAQSLRSSLVC